MGFELKIDMFVHVLSIGARRSGSVLVDRRGKVDLVLTFLSKIHKTICSQILFENSEIVERNFNVLFLSSIFPVYNGCCLWVWLLVVGDGV